MQALEVDRRVPEDALPPSCNVVYDGTNRITDPVSMVLAFPLGRGGLDADSWLTDEVRRDGHDVVVAANLLRQGAPIDYHR